MDKYTPQERAEIGTQNPQLNHETSSHPLKTTVWCGIHAGNIIGPYFFENDQGVAVTITAERYQGMIRDFLLASTRVHVVSANSRASDVAGCPEKFVKKSRRNCIANRGHHLADIIFQS
ncbi:hypothetical protein GWI33_008268 [Rhynchophorus ferrugineus]|uniref:Uncharacterized protein n=1 Tax=Rhynchophorus ferrugineus TaxID=354439 RepID=A0A834IRY1_RHYFE|nr:hypothetical protein GWI33_008268 [Rhynchophorus ferrugineus]